ncbi:unnamed protein product [Alternaria alternata]
MCHQEPTDSIAAKAPLEYIMQRPVSQETITEERLDVFDELGEPRTEGVEARGEMSNVHSGAMHGMQAPSGNDQDDPENFGGDSDVWDTEMDQNDSLPYSRRYQAMDNLYSMSMPKSSFMANANPRYRPTPSLISVKRGQFSIGSPKSFQTAQSSLASYVTASSFADSRPRFDRGYYQSSNDIATGFQFDTNSSEVKSSNSSYVVFGSAWFTHLHRRGILCDPKDELDWSGRGQHVEYDVEDSDGIPLVPGKILGHGASAIVESVKCRRIRLARKTIKCNRRLKKEDAITEVEHLMRLQHAHIVRVVGTYTLKKTLAILLYPVAEWTLDEFMDEIVEFRSENGDSRTSSRFMYSHLGDTHVLVKFLGCLSNAVNHIHAHNIKHMDIKPKNILVRAYGPSHKVYLTDFGIARAYASSEETITDTPISFTRTYAAPEVVAQEARGFSADVFSLGCVFMEMLATNCSKVFSDQRQTLLEARQSSSGNSSFSENIESVLLWYESTRDAFRVDGLQRSLDILDKIASMIAFMPSDRPSMSEMVDCTVPWRCSECILGSTEKFEAANT